MDDSSKPHQVKMILPVVVHGLNVWQHWKLKLTYITFAMYGFG